jgi:threonine dehydrogenase-like Zn-dependent dehydrogenase
MKAVQFLGSVPRWVFSRAAGGFDRRAFYNGLSNVVMREVTPPQLPNDEWVRVHTRYAGFCGSDKNLVLLHDSPSTSPFSSFPFTIGHENVGIAGEMGPAAARALAGTGIGEGSRVVVDPLLSCVPRGISPVCPACARGDYSLCSNFTEGAVSPGFSIGTCRDTGGGWSEQFVAHYSQLIPVPDNVSSENAVLIDAFCSSLHPVMRNLPGDDDTVLIIGCGIIGISAVAAIRAMGSRARIIVLAKYKFQADAASRYGADEIVFMRSKQGADYYAELADKLGGRLLQPMMGKRIAIGGANYVFDCVGSSTSIDDSLRFTAPGGTMVLVGLASFPKGVDWTPIWLKEIDVRGSFWASTEEFEGRNMRTYEVALELMRTGRLDLSPLLTHRFALNDYRRAIETNLNAGREGLIKSAFVFD